MAPDVAFPPLSALLRDYRRMQQVMASRDLMHKLGSQAFRTLQPNAPAMFVSPFLHLHPHASPCLSLHAVHIGFFVVF